MTIQATVSTQPITATVSGETVMATVPADAVIQAVVSGGIGPQGPAGTNGGPLEQLSNVQIVAAQPGDVLRYEANAWKNYPDADIVDGGNW